MIELKRNQDCCGCTACVSICPQHCITMQEDGEGFLYPVTSLETCTRCNACNKVCPVTLKDCRFEVKASSQKVYSAKVKAYAARIENKEILLASSSGGVFTAVASRVIIEGGVVYGAAWVNGEVRHIAVEMTSDLSRLRGSKYVQSSLDGSFCEVRDNLRNGRKVLFTGTPCQIAGLRTFLRKENDNLLTVEVACHGAPSPKVVRYYMQELQQQYGDDVQLNFRSKRNGWLKYKVTAYSGSKYYFYEGQKENIFMRGFLHELYSRPICYECPFKGGISGADITLADFWGIEEVLPDFPAYDGASLVLTHTAKGENIFKSLSDLRVDEVLLQQAIKYNGSLVYSEKRHPERRYFFKRLDGMSYSSLVESCLALRPITRLKLRIKAYLQKIGI